jgi:hypothetical protein
MRKAKLVYRANQYEVFYEEGADNNNYSVTNVVTGAVEYRCKTMPQAIAVAEQFTYMIDNDTWRGIIANSFDDPSMLNEPFKNEPDGEEEMTEEPVQDTKIRH